MTFRQPVSNIMQSFALSTVSIKQTQERIRQVLTARHHHMDQLRAILTPAQFATLALWVDRNPMSLQMLGSE